MSKVYEKHEKHFNRTSCYVILKDGNIKGKIAFKLPNDGAGRLYAYVHEYGFEMVQGTAGGYGYDKRSAAVYNAIKKGDKESPIYNTLNTREIDSFGFDALLRNAGYVCHAAM